jgi:2-keto-3-deoxy-L-rhamnonate aldolase RhmA
MNFFFITNSAELAEFASQNGADRIFVDLEILGKVQRQGHLNTVISRHSLADVAAVRAVVPVGRLLVRINPINRASPREINEVIEAGADIIMLPMFRTPREVEQFVAAVDGRARISLLVETVDAMKALHECVAVPGVDEVHIGLNDLHLELGKRFMFEPLADGLVDRMARVLHDASIPFGIGGVARIGEGQLPAERILAEHARLGSTAAILSRTFHRQAATVRAIRAEMDFGAEVAKLRVAYEGHLNATQEQLLREQREVVGIIRQIVARTTANDQVAG